MFTARELHFPLISTYKISCKFVFNEILWRRWQIEIVFRPRWMDAICFNPKNLRPYSLITGNNFNKSASKDQSSQTQKLQSEININWISLAKNKSK